MTWVTPGAVGETGAVSDRGTASGTPPGPPGPPTSVLVAVVAGADVGGLVGVQGHRLVVVVVVGVVHVHLEWWGGVWGSGCSSHGGNGALRPTGGESQRSKGLGAACARVTLTLPLPCHPICVAATLNSVPATLTLFPLLSPILSP